MRASSKIIALKIFVEADGPWNGQWEDVDESTAAHVICSRSSRSEPEVTASQATQTNS